MCDISNTHSCISTTQKESKVLSPILGFERRIPHPPSAILIGNAPLMIATANAALNSPPAAHPMASGAAIIPACRRISFKNNYTNFCVYLLGSGTLCTNVMGT